MSDSIITVRNLSKKYRIGAATKGYKTIRETIMEGITAPVKNLGRLRRMTSFKDEEEADVIWALKDVSFTVKKGEVLGIIGKNGAGKSTLLKILSRITEPTSGSVEIGGRISSLLEVGTGFHPELTGRENIFLNGAILGMRKNEIERKFAEIAAFSEIEKFLDTPVKRYSSGMYVRLAFAVAAHLEPEILLVDEVLAVGDIAFQKKCLGRIGDIGKGGRTVLVVSHNMPVIVNLCQRAILLDEGEIALEGNAKEVVQHYLSAARSAGGQVVWPDPAQAPGDDVARLHAVRIRQEGVDGATADVDIAKETIIEIEYWNLHEGALLAPGIWLKTGIGTEVLASGNFHGISLVDDPWYGRPQPTGLFKTICRIPANFLNEGRYGITAILSKMPIHSDILYEDVLSFDVHDTGEMRQEYYGGWLGVVRPRLDWHTEYLGTGEHSNG